MSRIVAGRRAVREALEARRGDVTLVLVDASARAALRELWDLARTHGVRVEEKSSGELDEIARGVRHQGVVAFAGEFQYAELDDILAGGPDAGVLLVALDEITDPHNFGAIVRSAVAFGVDGVVTLKHRSAPITPVVVRAAAGATEHARIARITNLATALADLSERGVEVVGLDAEGAVDVDELGHPPGGRVLVVGSEGKGLRRLVRERCDVLARIPMAGPIGSLNASVAAGIALFALARARAAHTSGDGA